MELVVEIGAAFVAAASGVLAVPSVTLAVELSAARPARRGSRLPSDMEVVRQSPSSALVVCVPSHDEEGHIATTVRSLRAAMRPGDRVLVVAHNCTDRTAEVARQAGAEVLVVADGSQGKSYALNEALAHLRQSPPELVGVVDADGVVAPDCLERLRTAAIATGQPVQGRYVFAARDASRFTRVSHIALLVRNWIRFAGRHRLGQPVALHGSGWVAPYAAVAGVPVSNSAMAEDFQFTIDLARAGVFVAAEPDAVIETAIPVRPEHATAQRTRWEHGHLHLLLTSAPRLLWRGVRHRDGRAVSLALHLMVPPLAVLCAALAALVLLTALLAVAVPFGWMWLPMSVAVASQLVVGLALAVSIARFTSVTTLLGVAIRVPAYFVAKLPIYGRFLWARQRVWLRTGREG